MHIAPAVDELFAAHYVALVRLAVHLVDDLDTAEDLVQDVFAALPASGAIEHPKRYLTTAVVNRARSVLDAGGWFARSSRRGATISLLRPTNARCALWSAADCWPPSAGCRRRQREVVVLRYYEELSVGEIATMLATSAGAVSSALNRALSTLATTPEVRDAD